MPKKQELMEYILGKGISHVEIIEAIISLSVNQLVVLNSVAMLLIDHKEYAMALKLLNVAYKNSQDEMTSFNLAQVLCCFERFESAWKILECLESNNPSIMQLRTMLKEKLNLV